MKNKNKKITRKIKPISKVIAFNPKVIADYFYCAMEHLNIFVKDYIERHPYWDQDIKKPRYYMLGFEPPKDYACEEVTDFKLTLYVLLKTVGNLYIPTRQINCDKQLSYVCFYKSEMK